MKTKESLIAQSAKDESKPAQLAKIMYAGIVRMIKAKKSQNGEKNTKLELDSDRKWRVNVPSRKFD
jgi:hypothetical protein